jgi:hypothetical protein
MNFIRQNQYRSTGRQDYAARVKRVINISRQQVPTQNYKVGCSSFSRDHFAWKIGERSPLHATRVRSRATPKRLSELIELRRYSPPPFFPRLEIHNRILHHEFSTQRPAGNTNQHRMKATRNFSRDTDSIFDMIVEINVHHDNSNGHV